MTGKFSTEMQETYSSHLLQVTRSQAPAVAGRGIGQRKSGAWYPYAFDAGAARSRCAPFRLLCCGRAAGWTRKPIEMSASALSKISFIMTPCSVDIKTLW